MNDTNQLEDSGNRSSLLTSVSASLIKASVLLAAANWGVRSFLRNKRRIGLEGKVVLITGATSGHGLVVAKYAAQRGAIVVVAARNLDDLILVQEELLSLGAKQVLIQSTDIRDYSQIKELVEKVIHEFGRIDILINNAGVMGVGPSTEWSLEDYEDVITTNFWGALYTTTEVLPHMQRQKFGRIANVVSVGGKRAVPHMLPYTASKFALAGLTEGMSVELAKDNIFVTGIYPSPMRTGGHTHASFKGKENAEYAWFGAFANTPFLSVSPHVVAKKLWDAICHGDSEVTIGFPARMMIIAQAVLPNLTAEAMRLSARLLPAGRSISSQEDNENTDAIPGEDLSGVVPSILNRLVPKDMRPSKGN